MFESKRRAVIFLSIAFILAVIAGMMFFKKLQDLNQQLGGMTAIYVANADISSRERIRPDQLKTTEIPNRFVTDGHVTSIEELTDKVSVIPLTKGDIITRNMLRPFSNVSEDGNRIVEMLASWSKVHFDQELEAMDRVDIIVSHGLEGNIKTEVFLTDIPVAMSYRGNEGFGGVALEVPIQTARKLIHMQNYADHIRILKSSTGSQQVHQVTTEPASEDTPGEESLQD